LGGKHVVFKRWVLFGFEKGENARKVAVICLKKRGDGAYKKGIRKR